MTKFEQRGCYLSNIAYTYSEPDIKVFSQSVQHPYTWGSNKGYLNFSITLELGGRNE